MDGEVARPRSPREAMRLGISFLPEDRHQQGLVLQFPIRANETLPILRQLANRLGLVDRADGGADRSGFCQLGCEWSPPESSS